MVSILKQEKLQHRCWHWQHLNQYSGSNTSIITCQWKRTKRMSRKCHLCFVFLTHTCVSLTYLLKVNVQICIHTSSWREHKRQRQHSTRGCVLKLFLLFIYLWRAVLSEGLAQIWQGKILACWSQFKKFCYWCHWVGISSVIFRHLDSCLNICWGCL